MDGQGDSLSKASGAESASASNTPSEEAQDAPQGPLGQSRSSGGSEGSHRQPPGPAELGGALGFFLKRTSQLEEPSGASQFSAMFRDLKSDDSTRQIMALTELSEYLSFSSEEALISFPMETFIPVLIGLLENPGHSDEAAAQVMLLCCRCLFNVVDILPPAARIITAAGGLPVLCANLLNVEYIDVAELAVAIIEWISEDQPLQVLKAGGLQAILTFLDFFQISVQRQAANAAALMLLPVPPADVLDQHVRPVLPTLATLLQHSDPQVLQSVCECWRRVLDGTIAIHGRPRASTPGSGPSSSLGRMVVKGKWRPSERGKKERGDEAPEQSSASAAAAAAPAAPLATFVEEMCPGSVLSNLLVLLANGISAPSPHSSVVAAEVLYILAVLTNYSDTFTEEVLKQDVSALLRQMVLAMDLGHGGHSLSQPSSGLLRVLAAVASMLPAVHLADASCECEEKRLALFREHPGYLDALGEAFLPLLVDVYEASMDPNVQSLCVTLLLAFFLACRERPELVRRSLDPTQLARFLANLLLVGASKSMTLACLLIVHELLERHPTPYSLLFVRHGVVRAIHRLVTREDDPHRRAARAAGKAAAEQRGGGRARPPAGTSPKARGRSKAQLVEEVAHRVLSSYFASSSHTGESAILRALGKIAKQLRASPTSVAAAHREALSKLHDLLLTSDGITAFELTCSGTASALHAFLYPSGTGPAAGAPEPTGAYGERLRLFIECVGEPQSDALARLVRLCVSAVQRIEQQPLMLFPTHASLTATLPPHLRLTQVTPQVGGKGDGSSSSRGGFGGQGGDFPPGFGSRLGGRGQDSGASTSSLLSVLKLLAKPVRVRMAPLGAQGRSSGANGPPPNFRALLMPFGGKAAPPRLLESKASGPAGASGSAAAAVSPSAAAKAAAAAAVGPASAGPSESAAAAAAAAAALAPAASASPAARLRNYLASKVSRKRAVPSTGSAASSSAPSEKRSGAAGARPWAEAKPSSRPAAAADPWGCPGAWDDEEGLRAGELPSHGGSSGSGARGRGSADGAASPRDEEGGGRARDRESLGEALEAVLLVEPFALVSALEDYIWEKHGPKAAPGAAAAAAEPGPPAAASAAASDGSAAGASAASAAASAEPSGACSATTEAPSEGVSSASAAAAPPQEPAAGGSAGSAAAAGSRVRLSVKQPAVGLTRERERPAPMDQSVEAASASTSPRTPLAVLDPGTPMTGAAAAAAEPAPPSSQASAADGAAPGGDGAASERLVRGGAEAASASATPQSGSDRKRVKIYLNGQLLSSKTSVVQSLVSNAGRLPRGRAMPPAAAHEEAQLPRTKNDRFLVAAEEGSGSDGDGGASSDASPLGAHTSPRLFCGAIWGRVHSMTYEIVDESARGAEESEATGTGKQQAAAAGSAAEELALAFAATDFDCLVQRHGLAAPTVAALQPAAATTAAAPGAGAAAAAPGAAGSGAACAAATEPEESTAASELTPRSAASRDSSGDAPAGATNGAEQEGLTTMLQLISAFHNVFEYLRSTHGSVEATP